MTEEDTFNALRKITLLEMDAKWLVWEPIGPIDVDGGDEEIDDFFGQYGWTYNMYIEAVSKIWL